MEFIILEDVKSETGVEWTVSKDAYTSLWSGSSGARPQAQIGLIA